jgi:hypothetical protein
MAVGEEKSQLSIGSSLVQIVLDEDGKFYRARAAEPRVPIEVTPIPKGLAIVSLWHYSREYGPTRQEEYVYELGGIVTKFASKEDIFAGKIAVRREDIGDTFPVEFYRLMNQNPK